MTTQVRRWNAAGTGTLLLLFVVALAVSPAAAFAGEDDDDGNGQDTKQASVTVSARFLASISNLQKQFEGLRESLRTAFAAENIELPRGIARRLEQGKPLPAGWEKKLKNKDGKGDGATTPPASDVTAPSLLEHAVSTDANSARITWKTNESSWGRVRFSNARTLSETSDVVDFAFGETHVVTLQNLSPDADYRFRIVSADKAGNTAESELFAFKTAAVPATTTPPSDSVAPVIFEGPVALATSSATVTWYTSESTSGTIRYGREGGQLTLTSTSTNTSALRHSVSLTGLAPAATYVYRISARDVSGNEGTSGNLTFTTHALPEVPPADTAAPQIITVFSRLVLGTSARIVWVTNELSDSRLFVGTTSPVATDGVPAARSDTFSYYHELETVGLATSTDYVYAVSSRDAAGNNATQNGNTFRTAAE